MDEHTGQRDAPAIASDRRRLPIGPRTVAIAAAATVLAIIVGVLVGVLVLHRPADARAAPYRAVTLRDLTVVQSNQVAVASCLELRGGWVPCREQFQTLDDGLAAFQHDLDATPSPACLRESDKELRAALYDMRLSAQAMLQAGPFQRSVVTAATAQLASGTDHLHHGAALADAARC
jgi:hypothetical protein